MEEWGGGETWHQASKIQLETSLDLAKERIQQKKSKNQHHQDKLTKKNSEQNVKMQNKMVKNVGSFNRPYTVTHPPGNANPAFIIAASAESEGRELQL